VIEELFKFQTSGFRAVETINRFSVSSGVSSRHNLHEQTAEEPIEDPLPYTLSADGHIISHDGFVIPKDFAEFYSRFPLHVSRFVRRTWTRASNTDRDDREQELLLHLMSVPENSKFREQGYSDRIQIFQPERAYGASRKQFFRFVDLLLKNYVIKKGAADLRRPLLRASTLSIGSLKGSGEIINEEYIMLCISKGFATERPFYVSPRPFEETVIVNEFLAYVETYNPELLSVIETVGQTRSFLEAKQMLGMSENLFLRARSRLSVLYRHFQAGTTPPRQRRVYRARKSRTMNVDHASATAHVTGEGSHD